MTDRISPKASPRQSAEDLVVPGEPAARVAAALAAGGRMVRDECAPSWWTLGAAAGNEVDIAPTHGRD